jgi:hypothetical protein
MPLGNALAVGPAVDVTPVNKNGTHRHPVIPLSVQEKDGKR